MLASIHQPDFLSYLGFFHKISLSDIFIVLDNIQFVSSNNSWTHRDKILTKDGPKWITISHKKNSRHELINNIEISYTSDWKSRSINLIKENYRKSDYFKEVMPLVDEIYNYSPTKLFDFNMRSIKIILNVLKINPKIILASEVNVQGKKNQLLINLLRELKINKYLAGDGSKAYMDIEKFKESNIDIIWHNYIHPKYKQMHGKFEKNLSIIDCMFNIGIDQTNKLLKQK